MKRICATISALLCAGCISAFAEIPLKTLRAPAEVRTSSDSAREYFLFQTDPSAEATVNGEKVHVYGTGAFGAAVVLKPGANTVQVEVARGRKKQKLNVDVVCISDRSTGRKPAVVEPVFVDSLFTVRTLEGAYLQYGDGGDRLGGSKMGYVDDGIVLDAVGVKGDLVKVMLSSGRYAYMEKEYLEPCDSQAGTVNSGSASVSNAGTCDMLSISLPRRVAYSSFTQISPSTISVDLYGVTNNTNWLTHRQGLEMIDYVDVQQVESDILRFVIHLKEQHSWGYSIHYSGKALCVKVKHAPQDISLANMTIGLDAGHGGSASGAVSPTGIKEKDVNLSMVYALKEILESKGARVVLTRKGDENLSMKERKQILLDGDVDLLISIHNNSGGSPLVQMGSSTYYKHLCNRELAVTMQKHLLELGHKDYGVTGNFNFSLCAPTEYPNVLLEVLFMSSLPEEELLAQERYHRKVAEAAAEGLEEYLEAVRDAR